MFSSKSVAFSQNLCSQHAGEVVGALSFSVGHGANTLKKVASVRMFQPASDTQSIRSYPLSRLVSLYNLVIFIC